MSASTSAAAGISVSTPSQRSSVPTPARQPVAAAGCVLAAGMPMVGAAFTSGHLAGRGFEQAPGLGAELVLPLGVEAGLLQLRAEAVGRGGVQRHALGRQVGLQRLVELAQVLALLQAALV